MSEEISPAVQADRERVVTSCVAAFAADPVLRHLFPDDDTYPAYAAVFFGRLFDRRVGQGTVSVIGGGLSVAMWDAPRSPSDDSALELPAAEKARVEAYNDAVHGALPEHPYWYLGVLGTHPGHKGRRWGHALLADGLRRAATDGLPAVLETSNPGNVGVYGRAGFEVVGELTAGPLPVWILEKGP